MMGKFLYKITDNINKRKPKEQNNYEKNKDYLYTGTCK